MIYVAYTNVIVHSAVVVSGMAMINSTEPSQSASTGYGRELSYDLLLDVLDDTQQHPRRFHYVLIPHRQIRADLFLAGGYLALVQAVHLPPVVHDDVPLRI